MQDGISCLSSLPSKEYSKFHTEVEDDTAEGNLNLTSFSYLHSAASVFRVTQGCWGHHGGPKDVGDIMGTLWGHGDTRGTQGCWGHHGDTGMWGHYEDMGTRRGPKDVGRLILCTRAWERRNLKPRSKHFLLSCGQPAPPILFKPGLPRPGMQSKQGPGARRALAGSPSSSSHSP